MDLYEHQGKDLFERHGIPLAERIVATTPEEASDAARKLGGGVAVKVQVQMGGRGKGGGVKLVHSAEEASREAALMLDEGFGGTPVTAVLVERLVDIGAQYYAAISLDRGAGTYLAMVSNAGGVDIEEVARTRPEAIRRVYLDAVRGLRTYQARRLAGHLPVDAREGAADLLSRAYNVLAEADATLVEINPFVLLRDGTVMALDAKVTIDDNALFRHPDLAQLAGAFPVDPIERRAKEAGLQYLKLDGEVGIIGNGAGLVMSTLDLVKQAGAQAEAANFLDVGGGASAEVMATSLEVILSDPSVKSVLVNIFGGITRCDLVARGILEALERVTPRVPIVVRLDGTNAEQGRRILAEADHPRIVPAETMLDAAELAAALAHEGST
ncbi:MAG TPA: ADP-forming succinate--CoA ligase subunit beta [Actinomycetota bacterium]|nr:ADP-forming succinate--CoA ligase subunit beta [Actinomycetota bacterium]